MKRRLSTWPISVLKCRTCDKTGRIQNRTLPFDPPWLKRSPARRPLRSGQRQSRHGPSQGQRKRNRAPEFTLPVDFHRLQVWREISICKS